MTWLESSKILVQGQSQKSTVGAGLRSDECPTREKNDEPHDIPSYFLSIRLLACYKAVYFLTSLFFVASAACSNRFPQVSIVPRTTSKQSTDSSPQLRVLTWNIFLMPKWTFQSPHNNRRAEAIAAELLKRDDDIICLEKAFDDSARRILDRALSGRYPYRYGPAETDCCLKINSGVWVVSRIPLSGYREIAFTESAGIERFACKGAILLSGSVNGQRFQLVATHLQGEDGPSYRPDHQLVRNRQIEQIRTELLDRYAYPGTPTFICGDLSTPHREETNPDVDSQPYLKMLHTLNAENGSGDRTTLDDSKTDNDLADYDTGRTAELDYILVRQSGQAVRGEWSRVILRHGGWDRSRGRQDLSYRYAVEALFRFETRRGTNGGPI